MYKIYNIYIHMHVFRPSQDLSVWFSIHEGFFEVGIESIYLSIYFEKF